MSEVFRAGRLVTGFNKVTTTGFSGLSANQFIGSSLLILSVLHPPCLGQKVFGNLKFWKYLRCC